MKPLPEIIDNLVRIRTELAALSPLSPPTAVGLEESLMLENLYWLSKLDNISVTKAYIEDALYNAMLEQETLDRPMTEVELKQRTLSGLWRAIHFIKRFGESKEPITLDAMLNVHGHMYWSTFPDSAGRMRAAGEDMRADGFFLHTETPLGANVEEEMYGFANVLVERLEALAQQDPAQHAAYLAAVLELAAWAQFQCIHIHPFQDGNLRAARLIVNLMLVRCGIPLLSGKYEVEHTPDYHEATKAFHYQKDYSLMQQLMGLALYEAYELTLQRHGALKS